MAELLLIRHAQASFGAADYDRLSGLGGRQAALLGKWLARCGVVPDAVATGTPRRQMQTAEACLVECGGPPRGSWLELSGLGEYDHETVVARHRPDWADQTKMHADLATTENPRRAFQAMYVEAIARWTGGRHDADYAEPWSAFRVRVVGALQRLCALDAKRVVAFTSGGPITAVLQHLLGLPDAQAFTLNWPLVNASVTRLRFRPDSGAASLANYNCHPHLDETGDPALVTYR